MSTSNTKNTNSTNIVQCFRSVGWSTRSNIWLKSYTIRYPCLLWLKTSQNLLYEEIKSYENIQNTQNISKIPKNKIRNQQHLKATEKISKKHQKISKKNIENHQNIEGILKNTWRYPKIPKQSFQKTSNLSNRSNLDQDKTPMQFPCKNTVKDFYSLITQTLHIAEHFSGFGSIFQYITAYYSTFAALVQH